MDPKLYMAIGPIIAAIIGAVVALVSLIISKESKLSEFRQAWIDSLRQEIADLLSNILHIKKLVESSDGSESSRTAFFETLQVADRALMLIRLRLNEHEKDAGDLMRVLQDIEDFSNQSVFPQDRVNELERDLLRTSKKVLKAEWNRVKAGEPIFKATKSVMLASLVALTAALLFQIFRGGFDPAEITPNHPHTVQDETPKHPSC